MTGPTYALASDPAYLAFLRASGLSGSIATADADRRRNDINIALGIGTDDLNASGEQERRGISDSQEDRGVYRSGQTLRRLGEQEASQGRRRSAIELAASGQLGDIESNLLQTLAGNEVRGAELGLSLSGDRTLADGNAAIAAGTYNPAPYTAAVPAPATTAPAAPAATPTSAVTGAASRYNRTRRAF